MDIDYLLALQDFRNSIDNALTPFMEFISTFAVNYLLMFPVLIYWCLDKKKGLYVLGASSMCIALNAVVKLTACVYRPWIRDARVYPAGNAITEATGYSFPSGHCSTAAPMYGGMAVSYHKKSQIWVPIVCVTMILLTGFSRNYLGVHTPQDVCVGLTLGAVSLFVMYKIFGYIEKNPEKEDIFLIAGIVFGIAALFYITLKPYPMDYVDGKLLVDPQRMMNDGYKDIGMLMAFCAGRLIEKHFIRFEATGLNAKGIAISLIGGIPTVVIAFKLQKPLISLMGDHFGRLCCESLLILFVVAGWPAVIKLVCGGKDGKTSAAAES